MSVFSMAVLVSLILKASLKDLNFKKLTSKATPMCSGRRVMLVQRFVKKLQSGCKALPKADPAFKGRDIQSRHHQRPALIALVPSIWAWEAAFCSCCILSAPVRARRKASVLHKREDLAEDQLVKHPPQHRILGANAGRCQSLSLPG